ncbi:hypothetical protein T03_11134 [Trichinella britovi]|uniref:Proteasomal ubiquitin receptor ADRM1 n=1 Tax=Trichinella britovi TaxID=45882 RepID=A0A0V1D3Y0_TRIBR|nr:hypothetical protein T03_11134 [Trichinella britovi]
MTRYTNLTVDMRLLHHNTRISMLDTVKGSPFKITCGTESAFDMESYILPQSLLECTVIEEDIQSSLAKMNPVIKQSVTRRKNMDVKNTPQMVKRVPHTNLKHSSTFERQLLLELEVYKVYQCAALWIPAVERGRADPRNLLVVIITVSNDLYAVGCRERTLSAKFTTADLDIIAEKLLNIKNIPQEKTSVKSATAKSTRSQGYVKCQCDKTIKKHKQRFPSTTEFRAGKVCRIGSRMSFDRRLGTCFMYEEDDMSLHFCWREYDTVDVEDGPARKDSVYCKTVNKILEDYEEKEMHKQEQLLESSKDKIATGIQPDDIKSHSDSEIILRSRTRKHTSLKSDLQQVFDEFLAELRILNNEKTIFLQDYLRKQSSDDHTSYSNSENAVDIKSILLNDKEKVKTEKCPSSSRLLKEECIMKKKNENTVFRSNAKKDKNNEKYLQSKADNGADMTKENVKFLFHCIYLQQQSSEINH